jgi:hypothetical protein
MHAERDANGDLWLRGISVLCIDTLARLPDLIESDDPEVKARLLPEVYDDPEDEAQWRRHGAAELAHLFASRNAIVRQDLEALRPESDAVPADEDAPFVEVVLGVPQDDSGSAPPLPPMFRLRIPAAHVSAWESALTFAAHVLYLLHGLEPTDIDHAPGTLGDDAKDVALLRIHIVYHVLGILLEAGGHRFDPRLDDGG